MYTKYISIQDAPRLRQGIDPQKKWLSDDEILKIIRVTGGDLDRCVTRCFISIQQKASAKNDSISVIEARNQQTRFEAGWLQI